MKRLAYPFVPLFFLAACATQAPAPVVDRTTPVSAKAVESASGGAAYVVKRGETLYRIALERGIAYRDLAAWNNISDPASLKEGQVLRLTPPGVADSAVAVVQPVQTAAPVEVRPLASSPAAGQQIASADLIKREPRVNKEPYSDATWESLSKPAEATVTAAAAKPEAKTESRSAASEAGLAIDWAWPSNGALIARFGEGGNKGIDFSGKEGDAITAAAEGRVFFVGLQKGYGNLLIVGHANGFISVYAHNRKILVGEKQMVRKGQKVAEMGKTDSESGVKLHFEIRQQGKPVDPALYLPKR